MLKKPHPELADHQMKALRKMGDGKILWGGVGSGKSRVGMAYYCCSEEHEDIYVITTAKKRDSLDWEEEAARFGVGKEVSLYGKLHVDSWNNLHKYTEVKNAFFIFDEQRLVGSARGKWVRSFLKISKHNRWIMLSATPGDTWMDYIPVFIANGFYRNFSEFKQEHVIYAPYVKYPKVERYVNVGRLVRNRNQILIHMPLARETVRHSVTVWTDYNEDAMRRVAHGRWNIFTDEPIRDKAELFGVMRRVVNSDPSRSIEMLKLIQEHDRLIIFYNFNYELDMIRMLVDPLWRAGKIGYAEWNGQKHEEIPERSEWVYAVQYAAGAEGWNCTTTNAVAFWSLTYSYKYWEQAHGRIDRLNTPYTDLYYYTMRSKAPIDFAIWRSLKAKKSFQFDDFDMTNSEFADFSVKNLPKTPV